MVDAGAIEALTKLLAQQHADYIAALAQQRTDHRDELERLRAAHADNLERVETRLIEERIQLQDQLQEV